MKVNFEDFEKAPETEIKRETEVYTVTDLYMNKLVVSKTVLHPNQHTRGHSHNLDEVYFVVKGKGKLKFDNEIMEIKEGDIITIDHGKFHQTINESDEDLIFLCVFEKYEERGK